jgi:type I restriction enzyme S subunit
MMTLTTPEERLNEIHIELEHGLNEEAWKLLWQKLKYYNGDLLKILNLGFLLKFLLGMDFYIINELDYEMILAPTKICQYKFTAPVDKNTQRKIASILSAYDDLIENNLKRIKLLEEKAFLRYKGIVREQKLEEKSILDICYVTDGTHDSPKQQVDGFYLVTGKHLIGGFIDFSSAYFISEADHDKIQKRSKVVNGNIVLSNIGTIGNVAIIDSPFEFSVKNVIIFKPSDSVYTSFLYCYLNSDEMQTRFQQESSGTSQRFISLAYARALKVKLPSEDVLEEFHKEVSSHLKLKSILNQQNAKLRDARDILLPKLMNGQIEI